MQYERKGLRKKKGFCIFPGYNWCGPGCSGPGAPINQVDACCRAHDECYHLSESPCICDQMFIDSLRLYINPYTKMGRRALIMYTYMNIQQFFTCAFK